MPGRARSSAGDCRSRRRPASSTRTRQRLRQCQMRLWPTPSNRNWPKSSVFWIASPSTTLAPLMGLPSAAAVTVPETDIGSRNCGSSAVSLRVARGHRVGAVRVVGDSVVGRVNLGVCVVVEVLDLRYVVGWRASRRRRCRACGRFRSRRCSRPGSRSAVGPGVGDAVGVGVAASPADTKSTQ